MRNVRKASMEAGIESNSDEEIVADGIVTVCLSRARRTEL